MSHCLLKKNENSLSNNKRKIKIGNNLSKENLGNNLRELSSEVIELKKSQDSFVKTSVEKKDIKQDEVVDTKHEENKIDIKALYRQLEESREYCKEQFLHFYITKKRYEQDRYSHGISWYYKRMLFLSIRKNFFSSGLISDKEDILLKLNLCNNSSDCPDNLTGIKSWLNKNITLKWIYGDPLNKKDFSLLGKLITSEDIADCEIILKLSDSLFLVQNSRTDELTKHIKDSIEYLKKISQVVKILDLFLSFKYSEDPSENEITEACDVLAIKILDDDGRLTKDALEKAELLKKQIQL